MPETKRLLKVFLCHASADKPKVRELYRYLRRRGIKPWFDEMDLIGGQDWQVEIPKAIAISDAIIICLTKNSIDKEGYVQKEIKFALDKALEMPEGRIYLIPVRFEECEVPFSLSRYQWVDLFDEIGFTRLMRSLKTRAGQLERANVQIPKPDDSSPDFSSTSEEKAALENAEHEAADEAELEAAEKVARDKTEKDALEKARLEAEELGMPIAAKEKAELEVAEKVAHEKVEIETAKKARLEAELLEIQKIEKERADRVSVEKATREKETVEKAAREQKVKGTRKKQEQEAGEKAKQGTTSVEIINQEKRNIKPETLNPNSGNKITYWSVGFIILVLGIVFLFSLNNPLSSPEPTPINTQFIHISTSTPTKTSEPSVTSTKKATSTPAVTSTPTPLPTEITNAKGVPMVLVSSGEFVMGDDNGYEAEKPATSIFLRDYYIDKFEVTNKLYMECVNAGGCQPPKNKTLIGPTYRLSVGDPAAGAETYSINNYYGDENYLEYPVVNVDWSMANKYCTWRGDRLPTEAEWEKAARGNGTTYPWGNEFSCENGSFFDFILTGNWFYIINNIPRDSPKAISWYYPAKCDGYYGTAPVGAFDVNVSHYGAFDMSGNVWEWVSSLYKSYPYSEINVERPEDLGSRAFRGGSFNSFSSSARSTARQSAGINYIASDLGLRCAKDASP